MTDCEDFMIAMCKQDERLTVNTLLDYILVGEKYGLTRFLKAAVELCARIDFDLLNGKRFSKPWGNYTEEEDKNITLKFSKIGIKTQYAISKKRLQRMEIYNRRNPDQYGKDVTIPLS